MCAELLENLIDDSKGVMTCDNGCGAKFTYKCMSDHYRACTHAKYPCPDPFCTAELKLCEMADHFNEKHDTYMIEGDSLRIDDFWDRLKRSSFRRAAGRTHLYLSDVPIRELTPADFSLLPQGVRIQERVVGEFSVSELYGLKHAVNYCFVTSFGETI